MKEVTPQLEDGASDLARILPSETPSERPAPPWGAIHELVAAGDSSSLQEAILSLMEAVGLDCPHLGLSGVRGEGWQLTAHRGVPESLLDQVRENLVRMASDLSEPAIHSLPGELWHHLAPIESEGGLLGVVGWLRGEELPAADIEPVEALIAAALKRLCRGAKQRKRSSMREAVRRAALAVGEAKDLGTMLQAIAERARLLTGAAAVAVRGRGADSESDTWVIRGSASVSAPRPENWAHRILIRHQGRQLAEIRLREGKAGERPTEDDLVLARLFAEHVGALVASASAKSQLMREISIQNRTVRWLAGVVEHLPVPTLLVHPAHEGSTTWLNRRAKSLLACEGELSVGELRPLLLTEDGQPFPPRAHPLDRVLRGEKVHRLEAQIVVREEEVPRFVVFHGEAISGMDACFAAVIALEDVSAFKTLERMREQWASLITHDLRQPLTSILGFASLLAQQEDLDPSIRQKLSMISAAARRLVRISRDLLDASLMDARQLGIERSPTDLGALARGLTDELSREDGKLPIRLLSDPELPPVHVDPVRIEQVLENLLSNARKYGRTGSEVLLRIERVGEEIRVHVHNEGEGLDPSEMGTIFTRFYRGQTAQRTSAPGMGLGLYICRALVEAHGGRIWATSRPGEEVVFSFTLPL